MERGVGSKLTEWPNSINYTKWNHYVLVYNGESTHLYHDGRDKGEVIAKRSWLINSLGRAHTEKRNAFEGDLDDIRIYNRALSESEAIELYNLENPLEKLE